MSDVSVPNDHLGKAAISMFLIIDLNLGSIGGLMKGSGLEEALRVVFAENAVSHMITRKAISRAVTGHFLVQSTLVTNLFKPFIDDGEDEEECVKEDISVEKDEKTVETVEREDVLRELENLTNMLKTRGKRRKISNVKITWYCFNWKI